ncbi:MAG: 2,3-epoxybenzoyl-CoA dihydrolase [Burkholderiaceae bacterium]|jgi:benzoyl-CoA-dihydrodiol lyase|nr:2,3-epoxybenzoyl-CoA dihydrolase [Burkholderiaceae bacterium]
MSTNFAVNYETQPDQYRHWSWRIDGEIATLSLDIQEDGGILPGYKLKLNSYDLGVDIELNDAVQRLRFEHPQVKAVVLTSLKDRIFCSGANIFMLGLSTHAWKVNFCKFTNETRNGLEDSSRHGGLKFLAAVNGACAGGGYELALACDDIVLVDDRSSSVSLPEVPLLGVLPGTGGLTRITDKRHVRHDHADVFCTSVEGVRGQRAVDWRLVDAIAKPAQFSAAVAERASALAAKSERPGMAAASEGVKLQALKKKVSADGVDYEYVQVVIDRDKRTATLCVSAPTSPVPDTLPAIQAAGDSWYPLQMARELDDAILVLRTNELDIGTWLLKTQGNAQWAMQSDAVMLQHAQHWLVRETMGLLRRTLARLDVSSRSLFALIDQGSCFAGTLAELALAADRSYMLALPDDPVSAPQLQLSELNLGYFPMVNHQSRLQRRFYEEEAPMQAVRDVLGQALNAEQAVALGLVTAAPDDMDWADEIRIAIEERAAMSPDSLTGLEANLRFSQKESMETRIFGRLSAWQNWIFNRPNAVGDKGALKVYGKGEKAAFDMNRV